MKFVAAFLAFLTFVLTFADLCNDDTMLPVTGIVQQRTSHNDDKQEICSPFCTCLRCAFSVVVPQASAAEPLTVSPVLTVAPGNEDTPVDVTIPVWQPPKVTDASVS